MKISLNYQHQDDFMQNADEIIVPYGKMDKLLEIVEKFNNKDIVVDLPEGVALDWREVAMCAKQLKGGELYVRMHLLNTYTNIAQAKQHNIKFFYAQPVKTYYEAYGLKKLGVSYIYVDAPLFFQMDEVKKIGIPLRLIPNRCYIMGTIPRVDGLHGCWIRPEKLDIYEPYADVVEFFTLGARHEMALYKIYINDKQFIGDMNTLFSGLNLHMDNKLVYEGLDEIRLNCGQNCETTKPKCMMCHQVLKFERIGREWAEEALKRQEEENKETEQEITN